MAVTCFMLEHTGTVEVGLRRYESNSDRAGTCLLSYGYHNAQVILGQAGLTRFATRDEIPESRRSHYFEVPGGYAIPDFTYPGRDDPRWPATCECGYRFTLEDHWQEWSEALYRMPDGTLTTLRAAPDGAMWNAFWLPWKGPDGRCLMVKCPGGHEWIIDGRATNCTLPKDSTHKCWVRTGDPPKVSVGKSGGYTCSAGGGSIVAGNYHGFLIAGTFT